MSTAIVPLAQTQEESAEQSAVTYPCTFPACTLGDLTADLLFVPPLRWMNYEVGRRRPVTDWFSQATELEMAEFARCQHHAHESAVGLDYNHRKRISTMIRFSEALKLADYKRDQAQFEKDQQQEAYRTMHLREREQRKARRAAERKVQRSAPQAPAPQPKKFGDEMRFVAAAAPGKKKGKQSKKGAESKKPGKKGKGR